MLEPLRRGITVEGENFQPMDVTLDRQQGANAWLTIGLREGRNRQIRRMCEMLDLRVMDLWRTHIGPITLDGLPEGRWRHMTAAERAALTGRPSA